MSSENLEYGPWHYEWAQRGQSWFRYTAKEKAPNMNGLLLKLRYNVGAFSLAAFILVTILPLASSLCGMLLR